MKTLKIQIDYEVGQTVYLKTDSDQLPRLVVGYSLSPKDLLYRLQYADCDAKCFYDFEISDTKDVVMATSN